MLASLPVALLEGLAEVQQLGEAVREEQRLDATGEFERLGKEGLGQLGSQKPLSVAVLKGAHTESHQGRLVLAS